MKTILVIDGALNCAYDCFSVDDDFFELVFPLPKQDIEFIEDLLDRHSEENLSASFDKLWRNRIEKKRVQGIDGVLFFELLQKKEFYPNKRDSDLDGTGRGK